MPPRRGCILRPWEREKVAAGRMRVVGKMGTGGCKDFAPSGATDRREEPTATRLQPSAQRWPTQSGYAG